MQPTVAFWNPQQYRRERVRGCRREQEAFALPDEEGSETIYRREPVGLQACSSVYIVPILAIREGPRHHF